MQQYKALAKQLKEEDAALNDQEVPHLDPMLQTFKIEEMEVNSQNSFSNVNNNSSFLQSKPFPMTSMLPSFLESVSSSVQADDSQHTVTSKSFVSVKSGSGGTIITSSPASQDAFVFPYHPSVRSSSTNSSILSSEDLKPPSMC